MKKTILVLVILNILLFASEAYTSELKVEEELKDIYSKILCIGCAGKKTIDHSEDCPIAKDLRAKAKVLLEEGFNKERIVYNFNRRNIAFIYQLPQEVIRNLNCPCACREKVWVCIAGETDCPVIETLTQDIRKLKEQGESNSKIVELLKSNRYQNRYGLVIKSAINRAKRLQTYDTTGIPDFVLDNAICSCECTESLRSCIEKMPWCKRIESMISTAKIYLYAMKLEPEDVVSAMYAPCAKVCAKRMEGEYLGKNCSVCQRPVLDKAYYGEVDGKEEVFCCRSCYELGLPLPSAILNNIECKVCPCGKLLSECKDEHCPLLPTEKKLIKLWLLQDMSQDEVIMKLR
jgi:cytochrome c-type biogenesis protein CcmH/NrfF